jgi:hypothetical protein
MFISNRILLIEFNDLCRPGTFSPLSNYLNYFPKILQTCLNKQKYLLNITFISIRKYIHFHLHLDIVVKL